MFSSKSEWKQMMTRRCSFSSKLYNCFYIQPSWAIFVSVEQLIKCEVTHKTFWKISLITPTLTIFSFTRFLQKVLLTRSTTINKINQIEGEVFWAKARQKSHVSRKLPLILLETSSITPQFSTVYKEIPKTPYNVKLSISKVLMAPKWPTNQNVWEMKTFVKPWPFSIGRNKKLCHIIDPLLSP